MCDTQVYSVFWIITCYNSAYITSLVAYLDAIKMHHASRNKVHLMQYSGAAMSQKLGEAILTSSLPPSPSTLSSPPPFLSASISLSFPLFLLFSQSSPPFIPFSSILFPFLGALLFKVKLEDSGSTLSSPVDPGRARPPSGFDASWSEK